MAYFIKATFKAKENNKYYGTNEDNFICFYGKSKSTFMEENFNLFKEEILEDFGYKLKANVVKELISCINHCYLISKNDTWNISWEIVEIN